MTVQSQPRIVVVGGGFGGLESAFYLRIRLQDRAHITLVSDQDHFLFKPNTIYIPFGLPVDKLMIGLEKPTRRHHIDFVQTHIREIDPVAHTVRGDGASRDNGLEGDVQGARSVIMVNALVLTRGTESSTARHGRLGLQRCERTLRAHGPD